MKNTRNPYAKAVRTPRFKMQVVPNKKPVVQKQIALREIRAA